MIEATTTAALLVERAAAHPGRLAIVQYRGGRRRGVTYRELAERVARIGTGLRLARVGREARALVFLPMSIELYTVLLGLHHAGVSAVFMDAWADRGRLDAAVRQAAPNIFIGSPRAHLLRLLSPAVRRIRRSWIVGGRLLPLARYGSGEAFPPLEVPAEAEALVTFTTGSTGAPKGAARSHRFLLAQHRVLAAHLRLRDDDVDMPTLPVFVLNNLALGITSVLPDMDPRRPAKIDPRRIVRQMEAEGVTTASGSPAFFERLAAHAEVTGSRIPLRALWTGGAPVFPPLARRLEDAVQGSAHVVYGSTEAEPISGISAGELAAGADEPLRGICVGRPVPEIEVRIIRPHTGEIRIGPGGWEAWTAEAGEIVVRGDHVLPGYLASPEDDRLHKIRTAGAVWHRTGDGGSFDERGRLWLLGRVSQRVRRGGESWWPAPAEAAALAVPGVGHAAYLGTPDARLGERAVLCVERASGLGLPTPPALRAALAPSPVDEVRVMERIPRDPRHESKTELAALRRILSVSSRA